MVEFAAVNVSVITVCYNVGPEVLTRTVESVEGQSVQPKEHIIIDGASTDGTAEFALGIESEGLKVVSEPDRGISDAFNKGIRLATGDYLMFLNADDTLAQPDSLRKLIDAAQGAPDLVCGRALNIATGTKSYLPSKEPRPVDLARINHQSTLVHKRLFETAGYYREDFRLRMDYEFWLRAAILQQLTIAQVDEVVVRYAGTGRSAAAANRTRFLAEGLRALAAHKLYGGSMIVSAAKLVLYRIGVGQILYRTRHHENGERSR